MNFAKKAFAIALLASTSITISAETLTIEGGGASSTTGLVPQSFAPYASKAGYDLQVVLNQVLTKSILKVAAGQLDLSVAPPPAYRSMQRGVGPYQKTAEQAKELSENVRALFAFQGSTMHPLVWENSGIKTWDDVKGKRVFVGPPAGAAASQTTGMVEAASGLKGGEDYEMVKLPWGQAAQGFQDGQFDVYVAFYPIGSQVLTELSLQRSARLLQIPESVINSPEWAAYEAKSGVTGVKIAANTYETLANGSNESWAGATSMMVIANKSLSDEDAYNLTKAYFEALPEMKKSNALLRSQDESKPLFGITARLHPGAIKYYREVGVEIPENLL